MQHPYLYKEIGQLSNELVLHLQDVVPTLYYQPTLDFKEKTITVANPCAYDAIKILNELSKYFDLKGHLATNIALMKPMTYLSEHTDYCTKDRNNPLLNNNVVKLQIPIITNNQVGMMWHATDDELYKQKNVINFETGKIYIINNIDIHSVVNLSDSPRYFLTTRFYKDSILDTTLLN